MECDGDPVFADPVYIVASDKDDPADNKANIWFEGEVALDGDFTLEAANGGKTKLKAETHIFVYDLLGTELQAVEFHTSCSQPLDVYDQWGGLLLIEFVPE